MRFQSIAVSLIVLLAGATTPVQAQAPAAPSAPIDVCAPAYAARIAEASASARADLQAKALTNLVNDARSQLGDKSSVKAKIDARYAVAAAGGLAQNAYLDTAQSYFCSMRKAATNDAAKVAIIDRQEKLFRVQVLKYFDPGLWVIEATDKRSAVLDGFTDAAPQPPLVARGFVDAAIPTYNFDTVKLYEITGEATFANAASVSACAGIVRRSIKRISPSVLSNLQNLRGTVIDWMSGDQTNARLDMWTYTASQMGNLVATAGTKEEFDIKPETIVCMEKVRDESAAKTSAPPAPPSTPQIG